MKISVIIPVYKVEKQLSGCLDSIIAQSYRDWECILVDDGSPDKSGVICDDYAKHDDRFRVIHKENGGVTSARKLGIEASNGEWITFVDSDDYVPERAFERMLLMANDQIDIVMGAWEKETNGRRNIIPLMTKGTIDSIAFMKALLLEKCYRGPVGKLYRRNLFNEDLFDMPKGIIINEDLIMNLRLAQKVRNVCCLPNVIVYRYITNEQGATHTNLLKNDWEATFSIVEKETPSNAQAEFWFYVANLMYVIPQISEKCSYYNKLCKLNGPSKVRIKYYQDALIHKSGFAKGIILLNDYIVKLSKLKSYIKYKLHVIK